LQSPPATRQPAPERDAVQVQVLSVQVLRGAGAGFGGGAGVCANDECAISTVRLR
jgi:hypothetical protein